MINHLTSIIMYISLYREYVEMIDLTGCESEGDGSGSEIDELPQPAITLESSRLIQKKFLFRHKIQCVD